MSEVVLVTGMGGELGTRVAQLLEEDSRLDEIIGVDFVPPRRRLRRCDFRRIDPRRRERMVDFVTEVAPTILVHLGVYEPAARMGPRSAAERTELSAAVAMSSAARAGNLTKIVMRSGIEVYGRRSLQGPTVPDELAPPAPNEPFGHSLMQVETIAARIGRHHDVPVTALRLAPVVGSHVPSPLGRMLRLPAVPVPALADPPFSLVHPADAAAAFAAAVRVDHDGPINIVGPGAASPWQAVRLGGRVPVPIFGGPGWSMAKRAVELAGAAIAPHVLELMRHGRTAAGSKALEVLGLEEARPTQQVLRDLYEWAHVVPMTTEREVAA